MPLLRLSACLFLCTFFLTAPARGADAPRLVVVISLDQFRADYLDRFAPFFGEGGFRRLRSGGAEFVDCHLRHGVTNTGPGHAAMLSGVYANVTGIVANTWLDMTRSEIIAAVEDRDSPLVGLPVPPAQATAAPADPKTGRSPRNFLATTVGDQLKLRHGSQSRVIGIGNKDRVAILMSGRLADAAYWEKDGRIVTSRYYRAALPDWVEAFNAERRVEAVFGRTWERLLPVAAYDTTQGPDDAPGETATLGLTRTLPKVVTGGENAPGSKFYDAFDRTPFSAEFIFELAKRALAAEKLGQHPAPDMLCIGIAQTDVVGHDYGPDSHEVMDSVVRIDRMVADFLDTLDRAVGLSHCIVVLVADHGVAPLPERAKSIDRDLAAGRYRGADLDKRVFAALDTRYGPLPAGTSWAVRDGLGYHVRPAALQAKGLSQADLAGAIRAAVLTHPGIQAAYTRQELTSGAPLDAFGEAMRLSYHPARSPDIVFTLQPYVVDHGTSGTNHGTPYDFDNHVPLVFFGPGVPQGTRTERIGLDDLAPTLSALLGVPRPPQSLGRRLF